MLYRLGGVLAACALLAAFARRIRPAVVRHGTARCYRAVPLRDRATIGEILHLRGQKYAVQRFGLAIGFDRLFRSRERPIESYAVAIRLDPCPAGPTGRSLGKLPKVATSFRVRTRPG